MPLIKKGIITFNKKNTIKLTTKNKSIILENEHQKNRNNINTSFSYHLDLEQGSTINKNKLQNLIDCQPNPKIAF